MVVFRVKVFREEKRRGSLSVHSNLHSFPTRKLILEMWNSNFKFLNHFFRFRVMELEFACLLGLDIKD